MTTSVYHNFIGIDIGKFNFVVAVYFLKTTQEYENNVEGINQFLEDHKDILKKSLCIIETTGGYELQLLYTLCSKKIAVHRADTRKIKSFIRLIAAINKVIEGLIKEEKSLNRYYLLQQWRLEILTLLLKYFMKN